MGRPEPAMRMPEPLRKNAIFRDPVQHAIGADDRGIDGAGKDQETDYDYKYPEYQLQYVRTDHVHGHPRNQIVLVERNADVVGAVREITGGAHVSIDALGHPSTCFNSIACLRRRGRHVQIGLMLDEHAHPKIPMDRVIAHELQILGSHGMQAFRYGALLDMITTGKIAPQKLVGRTISLDDAPAALMAMDRFEGTGIGVITRF